jgi:putative FmdB family regulatory protein
MLLTVFESKVKIARLNHCPDRAGEDEGRNRPLTSIDGAGLYSAFSGGELRPFAAFKTRSMPTYEYSCEKCGKTFETFQSMRDEPLRECTKELCRQEKWGHGKLKRLLGTGAGLIFKGSGFYITDYRSDSYKEGAKKDAPAAPVANGEKSSGAKESSGSVTASAPAKASGAKPKKQSTK